MLFVFYCTFATAKVKNFRKELWVKQERKLTKKENFSNFEIKKVSRNKQQCFKINNGN